MTSSAHSHFRLEPQSNGLRIGLIGPDSSQPCGIADYTVRLAEALNRKATVVFVPFRTALLPLQQKSQQGLQQGLQQESQQESLETCHAILVQYERSLVPDKNFMPALAAKYPNRVFVIPHEVYADDPFAFSFANLQSSFLPLLWLKRWVYKLRHWEYAQEKKLQAQGYGAHGVFPLSGPGAEILRALTPDKVLETIPLAFHIPGAGQIQEIASDEMPLIEIHSREKTQSNLVDRKVIGIFGFLNPGLDYTLILDLLLQLESNVTLLLIGGFRPKAPGKKDIEAEIKVEAEKRNLSHRIQITGFLEEAELHAHYSLCTLFICPMRFKSNSSSILNLIHLRKPIWVSDIPLSRYLLAEGAPLQLYAGLEDLTLKVKQTLAGKVGILENQYPWSFDRVAEAYCRALGQSLGRGQGQG